MRFLFVLFLDFGVCNSTEVANEIIDKPQSRNANQDIDDARNEIKIARKQPADEVEIGDADQEPVDSANDA